MAYRKADKIVQREDNYKTKLKAQLWEQGAASEPFSYENQF